MLGEYRYGLRRSRLQSQLEPLLETLISECHVLAVDVSTSHHYATVREKLRTAGTPLPENDVWIAALARQHGTTVVTRDRYFDRVEDVERVSW